MPSISGLRKIVLRGHYSEGGSEHDEGIVATGAISPGMNVVRTNAAEAQRRHTFAPGATAAGATGAGAAASGLKIATEQLNVLQGKNVDQSYPVGEAFSFENVQKGDIIQVLVKTGQTVVKTNGGSADSTGKWIVATVNTVVEFLEASGGALAADTLMRAQVL